jgi:hypothetical protein
LVDHVDCRESSREQNIVLSLILHGFNFTDFVMFSVGLSVTIKKMDKNGKNISTEVQTMKSSQKDVSKPFHISQCCFSDVLKKLANIIADRKDASVAVNDEIELKMSRL